MKKFLIMLMVVAMASFLFVGCQGVTPPVPESVVNQAPEITSAAITSATVGVAYTYDVTATDPDTEDVLTYSLTSKPAGMTIVAATGVISWTPTATGSFPVGVKVSDVGLLSDTQSFSITVSAVEPVPEPGLTITGITVLPEKMILFVKETEAIKSVIATYELRSYEVSIDLEDCIFLTSDSKIATVDKDGIVTAVKAGTATITASYKGKMDTLAITVSAVELDHIVVLPEEIKIDREGYWYPITSVTAYYSDGTKDDEIATIDCDYKSSDKDVATVVKNPFYDEVWIRAVENGTATITVSYTEEGITKTDTIEVTVAIIPMEIIAHLPTFFGKGIPTIFTIETVANSDVGKMVRFYFTLPTGATIEYQEVAGGAWIPLVDVFGPVGGSPLGNITTAFRGTFSEAGTFTTTIKVKTVPGGVQLCSKDIDIEVLPFPGF